MPNDTAKPFNQFTELTQTLAHVEQELAHAKRKVKELSATRRRLVQAKATLDGLRSKT